MKLLLFNIAGATLFLFIAVPLWAEPEVANIPGAGAGSPIVWVLMALPVAALCLLVNLFHAGRVGISAVRRRPLPVSRWHWLVVPLWAVVLYVDISHHWLI